MSPKSGKPFVRKGTQIAPGARQFARARGGCRATAVNGPSSRAMWRDSFPRRQKASTIADSSCVWHGRRLRLANVSELVISIRHARPSDAAGLSAVHDAAWREAYRGVIPGVTLERMVMKRGPRWWRLAAAARSRSLVVLDLGQRIGGYAS